MVGSAHPTFLPRKRIGAQGAPYISFTGHWPLATFPPSYFFFEYSLLSANPMIFRII
jgi:hypothetical protein